MPNFPDPDLRLHRRLDEMEDNMAEIIIDLRRSVQLLADNVGRLHARLEKLETLNDD